MSTDPADGRPQDARGAAPTRVFLVDDHAMVRAGVRAELGTAVTVVGEAADVSTAVDGIRATAPDVVLLDVHLPGGGGRAVLEALRGELPGTRWLALSVSDAAEDVIAVIRAGARGYVTKTISGADLRAAVQRVADGDAVFSPRLAGFVLDAFAAGGTPAAPAAADPATDPGLDLLSAREREVMQLLARGYTYREIGGRLFISVKTVESHASNVLRKLQLSNRNELTRWAATNRLL
jgi:DNA-binding NarL/FixJ family response regulator